MLKGCKLGAAEAFYLATPGKAKRLHLDDGIGNLEIERWADIVVLNPSAIAVLPARQELSTTLEERLFALMMLGDDRAVQVTYVAGQKTNTVEKVA